MGSIFSSKHSFSSVAIPIKEATRMGKILKARKRALDAKTQRKINAKRRAKERIYKQEEKERKRRKKLSKQSEKSIAKHPYIQKNKPIELSKTHTITGIKKAKYNKWGDRIA